MHGEVTVVGRYANGREGFVSPLLRKLAEYYKLCFPCSHFKVGRTFYGPGWQSEIDDIMISQGTLRDVEMCRIIKRLAARVTSIDVKGRRGPNCDSIQDSVFG